MASIFSITRRISIRRRLFVAQLDGSERRRLLDADTAAVYLSSGYLVFVRQGTLYAQGFDPARLVLTGSSFRLAEKVAAASWFSALSLSNTSTLVYRSGAIREPTKFAKRPARLVRPFRQGNLED